MATAKKRKEKPRKTEDLSAERRDTLPPPCAPGSIEQQLDMCERGTMRGDEILHNHSVDAPNLDQATESEDAMLRNYRVDMSESGREGDEMSGDEHSNGYQGDESELIGQETIESGMPGEETAEQEREVEKREGEEAA